MKKIVVSGIILITICLYTVAASDEWTIDSLIHKAQENNPELRLAYLELASAGKKIEKPLFDPDNLNLSMKTNYSYTDPEFINPENGPDGSGTSGDSHSVSGESVLRYSLSPIPQITFEGELSGLLHMNLDAEIPGEDRVTSDVKGELELLINPFAGPTVTPREKETYKKALSKVQFLTREIIFDVECSVFDLFLARMDLKVNEQSLELEETNYEIAKKQYELGDSTYDDLLNAGKDLEETRQQYYTSRKNLLSVEKNFYRLFDPDSRDITVKEIGIEELLQRIQKREEELEQLTGERNLTSLTLSYVRTELETLHLELENTLLFDPNLHISARMDVPFTTASGSIELSFSPMYFQKEERKELESLIQLKKEDIYFELYNLELTKEMHEQSIAISKNNLEVSQRNLEQSVTERAETQLLYSRGERTEPELKKAELNCLYQEISVYKNAKELYEIMGDLIFLYDF